MPAEESVKIAVRGLTKVFGDEPKDAWAMLRQCETKRLGDRPGRPADGRGLDRIPRLPLAEWIDVNGNDRWNYRFNLHLGYYF